MKLVKLLLLDGSEFSQCVLLPISSEVDERLVRLPGADRSAVAQSGQRTQQQRERHRRAAQRLTAVERALLLLLRHVDRHVHPLVRRPEELPDGLHLLLDVHVVQWAEAALSESLFSEQPLVIGRRNGVGGETEPDNSNERLGFLFGNQCHELLKKIFHSTPGEKLDALQQHDDGTADRFAILPS